MASLGNPTEPRAWADLWENTAARRRGVEFLDQFIGPKI